MRKLRLKDKQYGDGQRLLHQENELDNAPIVPEPVEYEDIDKALFDFFDKEINITDDNGNKVPLFRLLSNQRFSEYSQTWEHTDEDGNLLMNFKTINREINPSWGTIHGGMANIPGNNRFTVLMREIIDDTGVECYEITSMSQPLSVDLKYTVTFVSSKLEKINEFNLKIIELFQSKQCYVFPNGHPMPMTLEQVGDDSSYDINERKFYNQPINIEIKAYIIPKDDIKVELVPKRKPLSTNFDYFKKTLVDMDFPYDEENEFNLTVKFKPRTTKVSFVLDDYMDIELIDKENIARWSMTINDDDIDYNGTIRIHQGDEVKIKIKQIFERKSSHLIFKGLIL